MEFGHINGRARARRHRQRAVLAIFACGGLLACGDATGTDTDQPPPDERPIPPAGPHFSVPPVPVATVARITPIGYNNKVFPTPHTYWQTCDAFSVLQSPRPCHQEYQPIRAPGDGTIRDVEAQPDGKVVIEGPPGLFITFGHVTAAPGLAVGDTVRAGDVVATMYYDHGFDFGAINYGVFHTWVEPTRLNDHYLHGENPVAQFPAPLRDSMLARVLTVDGDPLGRLSYDVAETASGAWFIEGAPSGGEALARGNDHMLLWLARHVEREETRILSVGELWPGMVNFLAAVDPGAPDWESITPASGPVALRLWNLGLDARPRSDWAAGTVLVEMLDASTLRIEWFDTHGPVPGFGDGARVYER